MLEFNKKKKIQIESYENYLHQLYYISKKLIIRLINHCDVIKHKV